MCALRRLLFVTGFLLLLSLSLLSYLPSLAQDSTTIGGTTPPGTVPISSTLYLPQIAVPRPAPPPVQYDAIPVEGPPTDRPAAQHGDLNLALRSYTVTLAALTLVDINGDTDVNAPQLSGIYTTSHLPTFVAVYRVYDWDWNCGSQGCRSNPLGDPPVTLLEMATTPNEPLAIPTRGPEIYAGGYKALVLYAEATRLTLVYTRHDTVAIGYTVHLEDITVDPDLLALYQAADAAGRKNLPALRNGQRLGFANGNSLKIAIRDTGSFLDPRSRKDWWQGH
jgi:hypothetical protein